MRKIAIIALMAATTVSAETVALNVGGQFSNNANYFGQSFVTGGDAPYFNTITFNWFYWGSGGDYTNGPYAIGNAYLLNAPLPAGTTPGGLSSITTSPSFLGVAAAADNLYSYDPTVTLQANTQYWIYGDALIPDNTIAGGNQPTDIAGYVASDSSEAFVDDGNSSSFQVNGNATTVAPSTNTPEPATIGLIGAGLMIPMLARKGRGFRRNP